MEGIYRLIKTKDGALKLITGQGEVAIQRNIHPFFMLQAGPLSSGDVFKYGKLELFLIGVVADSIFHEFCIYQKGCGARIFVPEVFLDVLANAEKISHIEL